MTTPAPQAAAGLADLADLVLRGVGAVVAMVGGFVTAALAIVLAPLRIGSLRFTPEQLATNPTRVPLAVVVAVAGALFLVWFARRATGLRWGPLLPAAGWFAMVVLALRTTHAGDRLVMPDDWVASLAVFGGTLVLVIGLVVGVTAQPGRARRDPAAELRGRRLTSAS